MEISSYMILHLPTTLTTSLTFRKNSQTLYSPEKTCVIEKTVFLKNFIVCINNICIAMFCYEMDGKSCYVYIKDFNRFMFHKTKNKNKKYFCKSCLQCFSSKNVLTKHKEVCLSINGGQSVRLEKGTMSLKIISNKYQLHLKFMLILRFLLKNVLKTHSLQFYLQSCFY